MPHRRYQRGLRLSLAGLLVNATLGLVKLLAGLLGNSTALLADAVESLTDIGGSLIVWRGLSIASRPADADHPYGHGRAEPLAALIVAVMLFAAGLGVAVEATRGLLHPGAVPHAFTLAVLIVVIVVKETMYQLARRAARSAGSAALLADAWHHRSDAITSLAAAAGIAIAVFGGPAYAQADDLAALFAVGVIFLNAYRILMPPLNDLMDREPPELIGDVRRVAEHVPGVAGVEKVYARKTGLRYHVDMHLEVDPEMTVRQAHEVAHAVKDALRLAVTNVEDVLIHIEPYRAAPAPGEESAEAQAPQENTRQTYSFSRSASDP